MAATTITIDAIIYDTYVDVSDTDDYMGGDVSRSVAWAALSTDEKGRAIVSASRRFERLRWIGIVTDLVSPQPLEWPRTNVSDCAGNAVGTSVIPDEIDEGVMLLAADIAAKSSLMVSTSTSSNVKRAVAGSVEIEFFRAQGGLIISKDIHELIACFLDGSDAPLTVAVGTDVDPFTGNNDFCRTSGFS